MSRVRIPTPLRRFTGGRDEVAAAGGTLRELLDHLEAQHAGIKGQICDPQGNLRRFVNVFVNDEDARFLAGLDTEVGDGDVISIVPAIAGGAESDPARAGRPGGSAMSESFRELMARLRRELQEIDPEGLERLRREDPAVRLIDVREKEEYEKGAIAGAAHIPRGFLELRIEEAVPDRDAPIVLYCAGGVRSLLAAESLQRLGYRRVQSLIGGFGRWKNEGRGAETPEVLGDWERSRYARHLSIPEVGEEGQKRLLRSRVLLIGAGGLGSPAAFYLGAAGVGSIGIVDYDLVDESNLQRQILHTTDRVGMPKTRSARETLLALNPRLKVETFEERLTSANAARIFAGFDVVVDGSDNFPTRYLVNDACVLHRKPNVHGSVYRFEGQVTVFWPGRGPCYRCLYPEPPPAELAPSCAEAGVLGILPGVIGMLEAVETVKILLGKGDLLVGRLIAYDALRAAFWELKLRRDPECRYCRDGAEFPGFIDYEQFCAAPAGPRS